MYFKNINSWSRFVKKLFGESQNEYNGFGRKEIG